MDRPSALLLIPNQTQNFTTARRRDGTENGLLHKFRFILVKTKLFVNPCAANSKRYVQIRHEDLFQNGMSLHRQPYKWLCFNNLTDGIPAAFSQA